MAVVATMNAMMDNGQSFQVSGTLAITGNYTITTGEAFNPRTISYTVGTGRFARNSVLGTDNDATIVLITGIKGIVYTYDYTQKTIRMWGQTPTSATAGTIALDELASAAYPATVTGDTITFTAFFSRQ